ncbi:hypothetical protein [Ancylomarina longa]|uniref:Uncharacterized protein n=1 Tax=Ancylomarina longa TaxID=2487017 RepID=A0A434AWW7_9BACT|nr:hypothetical protein [Ancylomarina longa]RUT78919.1 hypothetical protein DLK05_05400 [Ancylomarina longa]
MVKFILICLLPFKGIIRTMGVDFDQLRSILRIKLTMDNRRSLSLSQKKKESGNQLLLQAFVYAVVGMLMGISLSSIKSPLVSYTVFFAFIMIMIAMLMISEFTNVLIDTRDNHILMPRPVNSRTIVMAKILHIAFYITHMSLSLSIFYIINTIINHGIFATLLLLILIVLASLFTLFLTNIFYLGLMNVVSGQKLKDIIVYFQIAMAILFMGAYQLLPRMMDFINIAEIKMNIHWWSYLIPPVWLSGTMDGFINGIYDWSHLLFLILGILVPILSLFFVIKVLAPRFNIALAQLDVAGSKKQKVSSNGKEKHKIMVFFSRLCAQTKEEATAFKMIWLMSGRERKYKQTVYPAFGYILIFGLLILFNSKKSFNLETLVASKKYLFLIYLPLFVTFNLTQQLAFSDQPKSSWFYRSLPLSNPGQILLGAFKSVIVKYFLPTIIVISGVCLSIWGINLLDDIIFGSLSIILITSLIFSWQNPQLPFSTERNTQDTGGNFVKGILLMLSGAVLGGIHYGLSFVPYSVLIAIPIAIILVFLNFRKLRKVAWNKIN